MLTFPPRRGGPGRLVVTKEPSRGQRSGLFAGEEAHGTELFKRGPRRGRAPTDARMLLSASSEQVTRGKRSRCWEAMLHARAGRLHSRKDESRDAAPAGGETWERVVAIDKEIQALRDLKRKLQGADGSWPLPSSLAAAATTSAVKRSRKLQSPPAEEEGLRRAKSCEGRPSLARRRPQSGALPPRPPSLCHSPPRSQREHRSRLRRSRFRSSCRCPRQLRHRRRRRRRPLPALLHRRLSRRPRCCPRCLLLRPYSAGASA